MFRMDKNSLSNDSNDYEEISVDLSIQQEGITQPDTVFALGFEGMGSWGPHSFVKVGSWPVWFNTLMFTHLAIVALSCILETQLF